MFAWSKKFKKQVSSEFDWTNRLETYDSNNTLQTFSYSSDMVFYDEKGIKIDTTKSETPEQYLANTYINPNSTVLELGARYGTVSCIINNKLVDRNKQVSVEPDETVWVALDDNIRRNKCSINVHRGFVSNKPKSLIHMGYASRTIDSADKNTNSLSVEQIQEKYTLKFDTLVADCEGFLETFFEEHPFMYSQLHTVIFEADFPNKCNYDKIRAILKINGFIEIIHGFQNVYKKPWTFVDKVIYINADARQDRRDIMNTFFREGQIPLSKVERFSAIMTEKSGFIGCAKSHIGVLELAKQNRWKSVLVLEDDLEWTDFLKKYGKLDILGNKKYDALMLTGGYIDVKNEENVKMSLYTNAYIVKEHYYDTLIQNFKEGLERKIKAFEEKPVREVSDIFAHVFNIDVYWSKLQYKDNWLCVYPPICEQVASYSDINKGFIKQPSWQSNSVKVHALKWLDFLINE
jgi:glycosyl transferase, family 25